MLKVCSNKKRKVKCIAYRVIYSLKKKFRFFRFFKSDYRVEYEFVIKIRTKSGPSCNTDRHTKSINCSSVPNAQPYLYFYNGSCWLKRVQLYRHVEWSPNFLVAFNNWFTIHLIVKVFIHYVGLNEFKKVNTSRGPTPEFVSQKMTPS